MLRFKQFGTLKKVMADSAEFEGHTNAFIMFKYVIQLANMANSLPNSDFDNTIPCCMVATVTCHAGLVVLLICNLVTCHAGLVANCHALLP